ncbi:MAG: OB-fold domain-containing protein [Deltaproteobacteria bacterium]|nr:OB-fold domain-containing protein [Deltaproteobacteria bacterium]
MDPDATTPPLPEPDALTRRFWEACRQGRLDLCACESCGHLFLPPGPCCPRCWAMRITTRTASGEGAVRTFAVYRRTYHPGLPQPYVVAVIELREGPRLVSNVVGCAPERVRIDMPVRARFENVGEFTLPRFEPAGPEKEPS